jgi:hypothetical protein
MNPQRLRVRDAEQNISTISVKQVLNQRNEVKEEETGVSRTHIRDNYDIHHLQKAWKSICSSFYQLPDFHSTISKYEPEMGDNLEVKVYLDNSSQMAQFRDKRSELLILLREKLNNYGINLEAEIKEADGSSHVYTATEKFKFFTEKNPMVAKLKDILDLEVRL